MEIYEGLKININNIEVLSIIGGGGKTTLMFTLGEELKKLNKKVLLTTTTAISNPENCFDYYFLKDFDSFNPKEGSVTIFGDRVENGKLLGITTEKINSIIDCNIFDFILIEADGSKGKPIKGHAHYEPVISEKTTITIGIIGLDSLGKKVEEIAHRPEIFTKITNTNYSDIINEESIINYVLAPKGIFREAQGRKILILNKAQNEERILSGYRIRNRLFRSGFMDDILVANIIDKKFY